MQNTCRTLKNQDMVGKRKKAKQARSESSSQRLKEDRISKLPDPLICHILSHLPTKDAVSTSALSTTWKNLWLWVPDLELDYFNRVRDIMMICDRFFDSNRVSCIRKVRLEVGKRGGVSYDSCLKSWIDAAVKRKIQCLDLTVYFTYDIPTSLYTCETLVVLKLQHVAALPDADLVFHLPCLKTMHLMRLDYPSEASFEKLVSSCPVLEELKVCVARSDPRFYRVHSRSLKKLVFRRYVAYDSVLGAEVDAPLLGFLRIADVVSDSFVVHNLESNSKLDISLNFSTVSFQEGSESARTSRILSFVPGISRVRDMTADAGTFKVIHDYSKLEPLPQFRSLSRLHATLFVSDLNWLPIFLESSPSLKSLTLALNDYEVSKEMIQFSCPSVVPVCLLSSLEFFDFNTQNKEYGVGIELVKYILENSTILKKLTLHVSHDGSKDYDDISKELLAIPRRSAMCQVACHLIGKAQRRRVK